MKAHVRPSVVAIALVLAASAVYLPRLGATPTYLAGDELFAGVTAHALASTGRDLNGRFLPLYLQMPRPFQTDVWFQPIPIYAVALTLELLPLSEGTVRLPTALFAIADVVLMYLVGRRLFRRDLLAASAAFLVGVTPAHFGYSR